MQIKKQSCLIVCAVFAVSCQSGTSRSPSSFDPLKSLMAQIEQSSSEGVEDHEECFDKTREFYQKFFNLSSKQIRLEQYASEELRDLLDKSFSSRLAIRKQLDAFDPSEPDSQACLSSVRDLTRALRYFEDHLVEMLADKGQTFAPLQGEGAFFLKNPKHVFRNFNDLRSGDVILSRGNAYTSAAIARIGQSDAQFSHLSFVYKDEKGRLHTTEAHIEIGAVAAPIEAHLEQGNSREVVFRFKDPRLAHRAAKAVYEKVKKRSEESGRNIEYDFSMDYKDNKRLFCSEVVYDGFQAAAPGKFDVPLHKTKFSKGLVPFLRQIGLKVDKNNYKSFDTFAPGDIEFDHRFELVAEWRNPVRLEESRMKDAVLTKVFEWMEEEGYLFKPSFVLNLKSYSAWAMRRIPFIGHHLREKFPLNMNALQLKTFLLVDEVGETLLRKLQEQQEKARRPLSFKEMFHILEEFRLRDSLLDPDESQFHKRFRPAAGTK